EPDSAAWVAAENTGKRCAEAGYAVVTGGYGGTMEAVSKGASDAGGEAIGVTAPSLFPGRSGVNRYVTREIVAGSLMERLDTLTGLASGVIVLPGSIGTLTELSIAWNLNHVNRLNEGRRLPTVAVGTGWRRFWELATGSLGAFGGDVHVVDSADEAVEWLLAQPEMTTAPAG
ncbi:MAG: LOG family protein, partial [Actinomycetota bacterium]